MILVFMLMILKKLIIDFYAGFGIKVEGENLKFGKMEGQLIGLNIRKLKIMLKLVKINF